MTADMQLSEQARKINMLTQAEREKALDAARRKVAGKTWDEMRVAEPQLDHFIHNTVSRYPPEHMKRMRALGIIVLGAAFFGSAIRIFLAAFATNSATLLTSSTQTGYGLAFNLAFLIGAASVLLAESGQVAFTLWASSVDDEDADTRTAWYHVNWMQVSLRVGALGCTLFAYMGNAYVMQPPFAISLDALIAWTETLLPPTLVLIASNVLKDQELVKIRTRHAAQISYAQQHAAWDARKQAATAAWNDAFANAHLSERWLPHAANALRDALRAANRRSYAVLRELTDADWRVLVLREMANEQWYANAERQVAAEPERVEPMPVPVRAPRTQTHTGKASGKHTGEFDNAVTANADGTHTGTCPHCGTQYVKASAKGAKAALIAHKRNCVGLREDKPDILRAAQQVIEGVDNE
jgi:hypothetical protein